MINYFVKHRLAANIFMVALLVMGMVSVFRMPTKLLPDVQFPFMSFSIEWEGATSEIVLNDVAKELGKELKQIQGIKTVYATAYDDGMWMGAVASLNANLEEVKKDFQDALDNYDWPTDVDTPTLTVAQNNEPVGMVVLTMPGDINNLRTIVDNAVDDLNDLGLTDITVQGFPDTDILWKPTLDTWLSLYTTPQALSVDLQQKTSRTGIGSTSTQSLEIGVSADRTAQINQLLFVNTPIYKLQPIEDLASGRGSFFYGEQPAIVLDIRRTAELGTLQAGELITQWQQEFTESMPESIQVYPYLFAVDLFEGHVDLLLENAYLGLILVLVSLLVLLNGRVAFWTAAGIPVALIGAFALIFYFDGNLTMFSIFALLIALGIVVDDAIVVSEQTLTNVDKGMEPEEAASQAASRMVAPITAASLTTIAAFAPLLFLPGAFGEIVRPIPLVMICVLAASLFECFFILPNHLNHSLAKNSGKTPSKFRTKIDSGFIWIREKLFRRFITWVVTHRKITISAALGLLVITGSLVLGNHVKINAELEIEGNELELTMTFYPDTSEESILIAANQAIETLEKIDAEQGPLLMDHLSERSVRGNRIKVYALLHDRNVRSLSNQQLAKVWVDALPANSDVDTVVTSADADSEGRGGINAKQVGFRIQGDNVDDLVNGLSDMRNEMSKLDYLDGLSDNIPRQIYRVTLEANVLAKEMGMDDNYLRSQVSSWLSDQSIVKVSRADSMSEFFIGVDDDDSRRLDFIERLPVLSPDGVYHSLGQLAEKTYKVTPENIKLENGIISLNLAAQLVDETLDINQVQREVQASIIEPIAAKYGLITKRSESNQELEEFTDALWFATPVALLLIYLTLAWVFQSWIWPVAVVVAIPFAITGAVLGHYIMGYDLTIMSALGLFGLAGIVVNDSIILIDRFRQLLDEMSDVREAVIEAACQRFRAVLLTTITTMVGLIPLLFESSVEAQIIKTMAISLVFGLAYGTVVVLVITPSLMTLVRRKPKNKRREQESEPTDIKAVA
ncbi:efflux RND transporter permease subunit [Vibrio ulleungensis]|uniref:Efflux RND transporter permease subunit n=1 Tax=Vibrio ulleungensis TaxID=2807619 RepID=A0ABS2HGZ6_9VIBR|nr:efflux RND transporter permease subunit [Vibrio ulleungensis]MBM7036815.1 efflux RND transporter permease subunit [Vibrio ulleungensis]